MRCKYLLVFLLCLCSCGRLSTYSRYLFISHSDVTNNNFVYVTHKQLYLNDKPFYVKGINLACAATQLAVDDPKKLDDLLMASASIKVNTVRFWAFSKYPPETTQYIIERSRQLGLNLKFIITLGNNWSHCEEEASAFHKDIWWYMQEYKYVFLPHVLRIVNLLKNDPDVLFYEPMNEASNSDEVVVRFLEDVILNIRNIDQKHLILTDIDYELSQTDVYSYHDYPDKLHHKPLKQIKHPLVVGELGILTNILGVPVRSLPVAISMLKNRIAMYHKENIGVVVWGLEPQISDTYKIKIDNHGFNIPHYPGDNISSLLKEIFEEMQ